MAVDPPAPARDPLLPAHALDAHAPLLDALDMHALAASVERVEPAAVVLAWWLQPGEPCRQASPATPVTGLDSSALHAVPPGHWLRLDDRRYALKLSGHETAGAVALLESPPTAARTRWQRHASALRPYVDNALEKDRLRAAVQRLEQSEKLQRALFEIADLAGSDLDMPTMLHGLHEIVGTLIYAANFFIALYDAPSDSIRFIYFADIAEEEWQTPDAVEALSELEHSLTWHLIRGARPLMGATDELHRQVSGPLHIIGPAAADWLGVPMMSGGEVRGALVVQSYDRPGLYSVADQALLSFVGSHIITALDRKQARDDLARRTRELGEQIVVRERIEQQLKHEVLHDSLTGLPNRACLRQEVARALARQVRDPGDRFAILFMDLDRFKVVNDSAGHLVGDELLKAVAARFTACVRRPDIVARLGGDEFAVLMERIDADDAPARLARRLIDALDEPVRIQGRDLFTATSIGIVVSAPHYRSVDELLRDADIAMYRAKSHQRGRYEVFDEAMHRQTRDLLALEGELRLAIARGEFEPYFQPIVRLMNDEVLGYEALLRWNHPTRGVLAPGAFLQVAEAGGMLEAIDWLMYEATFRRLPALLGPDQYVNLNVSPRHFHGDDLASRLLELLRAHDVAPAQVRIEITEGALIDKPETVGANIDVLREAGVFTALDDFGTGYSSLALLHRFRFHTIKLDRSFVMDLVPGEHSVAWTVARSVVMLSRGLGLDVVAEGIEAEPQRAVLLQLGCDIGQGFLFARPAPLHALDVDAASPPAQS